MGFGRSERAVRINSADSAYVEDDLRAVLTGQQLPDALVVPKVGGLFSSSQQVVV